MGALTTPAAGPPAPRQLTLARREWGAESGGAACEAGSLPGSHSHAGATAEWEERPEHCASQALPLRPRPAGRAAVGDGGAAAART